VVEVRQPQIEFTDLDPVWADAPGLAHFINAVGVVPAYLEPFLIKVMRRAKEQLDAVHDADLLAAIDIFNRQEAQHYRLHQAQNRWIRRGGYDGMEHFEERCRRDHDLLLASRPLTWLLAYCEGFEALGLMTAPLWIDGRMEMFLPDADRRVVALWAWHMAEEYEHRSVVFDTLKRIGGANPVRFYLVRIKGLVQMLRHITPIVIGLWRYLMRARPVDRHAARAGGNRRFLPRRAVLSLAVEQGARMATLFSPRYDPARMPAPENLLYALAAKGS
jgi:predicted metal-dependent hydrolase